MFGNSAIVVFDIERVKCLLIFCYQLINDNTVCEKSDCWGLACLLVEMLTGTQLWYDLRHEDRETVQKVSWYI